VSDDRFGARAKLDDCVVHGGDAELFVVEGDSAASAVARVRDPRRQAVLPMQGKPLNAARASRRKVLEHPFLGPLGECLGTGLEAGCDPHRARFGKVLVLTDPDADGIHCGFLVLLFLHRFMRPLLDSGRVALVRPPWGEVIADGELTLAFSEPELTATVDRFRGHSDVSVRRYRGLAALDADLIRETCVDPGTRRTVGVTSADVAAMIGVVEAIEPDLGLNT
jgi:DNA gyrase subunit B/topoisomerase-4 subunit B